MKEQEEQFLRADENVRKVLPRGVKLVHTLRGHTAAIGRIAWSPDGQILVSPSIDRTIRRWNAGTGECLRVMTVEAGIVTSIVFSPDGTVLANGNDQGELTLQLVANDQLLKKVQAHTGIINSIVFDPTGGTLASAGADKVIKLWKVSSGKLLREFNGHQQGVYSLAFNPAGDILASGSDDGTVTLWNVPKGQALQSLQVNKGRVNSVAFGPGGNTVAAVGEDKTVKLWEISRGRLLHVFEGHTSYINCIGLLPQSRLMASKGWDGTVRLWSADIGDCLAEISEPASMQRFPGLVFHPRLNLLATVGSDPGGEASEYDCVIHIYSLDVVDLLNNPPIQSSHYVNAKVVLVGDTGVGKSGLSLVLNGQRFEATDSTPGRCVWTFNSQKVKANENVSQVRETLLWDLAGQPGYRVIHQLHLNEVAVALVVVDARSETDPLAGVRHWERALRLAQQRQGRAGVPMKKFLVSARNDRGTVSVSKERLSALLEEFKFDGYFETSAKEGWKIKELRMAIEKAIDWEQLPVVSSSQLFADIKSFLLNKKKTGLLLAPAGQLYDGFVHQYPGMPAQVANLRDQFDTCIGRLENRDLIRRLTFGGYVLLQPELLDAYGSAMVNTAKEEPDGLGSLPEEIGLSGKFFVPKEQRITDSGQEQLLLHATVEELVRHDLALRENADDGRYLVFPSQFNRDYEDAPEPKGKTVAITFDGPVQSLYSTLAVRLGHSGLFTTGRAEMWRNAAVFTAKAGGKCGLFVHEFAEGRGRLILFFPDKASSDETRFHFEEFVLAHARRRALDGTVKLVRFFVCPTCNDPVPDSYVKRLQEKGRMEFDCPCGGTVSLAQPSERVHFRSKVEAMDQSADRQRDFDAFVMSAKGETSTKNFREWAGGDQVTLAIVFTDVVGSTALGEEIRDEAMNDIRRAHFSQSRRLIRMFQGREIKTIGDSFMAAFKDVGSALDYALNLQNDTGDPKVIIRAGIHIGPMRVEEGDVFGGTVNFAARVVGAIKDAEIWLSDRAKEDVDRLGALKHNHLKWKSHEGTAMKGFPGKFTLWALARDTL